MKDIEKRFIDRVKKTRGFFITKGFVKPNSIGAEVGVAEGNVSWYMMKYGGVSKIHLIDPWVASTKSVVDEKTFMKHPDQVEAKYREVLRRFEDEIKTGQIVVHKMTGAKAAPLIEDNSLDWVFIDDDHTYEATYENFTAFIPKVKVGGYLLGDDHKSQRWFRVIEALQDIQKQHTNLKKIGVFEGRVIVLRKEA